MEAGKNYLLGVFADEDLLMSGVKTVRGKGVKIYECFTPFPVHGLEDALGYKRSRLPIVAFLFAMAGMSIAFATQTWMYTLDWQIIVGGKPFFPVPDFIPITFEFAVLLTAFGMVGTFFIISDLKPHRRVRIYDKRSTDDKHIMAIDLDLNEASEADIEAVLREAGAEEVNKKVFDN